jgi:sugar lactone lactonase YvrE
MAHVRGSLAIALILAQTGLAGCSLLHPASPAPGKRSTPVALGSGLLTPPSNALTLSVKQLGPSILLTGKVKIVSDNGGGIVSDNGGGVISNNSGSVIANNGAGVIANNGAGIVANNGGGLTGKVKSFGLLAGGTAHEFALADATITIYNARGAQLVDEHGKPITATTDSNGNYSLSAVLPAGNTVMRIALHSGGVLHGGQLSALLPRANVAFRTRPIDTASSLGAAYVLAKYVNGDQATFDKLPASEADSLYEDLAGALGAANGVPSYQNDDLVARTAALGASAPPVAHRLAEIRALLLGQVKLGDGRAAISVAMVEPRGLAIGADGALIIGEKRYGRIRSVDASGIVTTLADVIRGRVKKNYFGLVDVAALPDGSVLVATALNVFKIDLAGVVTPFAGNGTSTIGPLPALATTVPMQPNRLAVGADGTVYIAESRLGGGDGPARLIAVDKAGMASELPISKGSTPVKIFSGVSASKDGSIFALGWRSLSAGAADLMKLAPDGTPSVVATQLEIGSQADGALALASDGTLYVAQSGIGKVIAISPSGDRRVVAGAGGPPATQSLVTPESLLSLPDGTLLIADTAANVIRALGADGSWQVRAGIDSSIESRTDFDNIALNAPGGAAFDANGGLIMSETGGNLLRRFDGTALTKIAGTVAGYSGDGAAAKNALFSAPTAVAIAKGEIFIRDSRNYCIRKIGVDGIIQTIVGPGNGSLGDEAAYTKGERRPAANSKIKGTGLAVDQAGRPYWSSNNGQVLRLNSDGFTELVAGVRSLDNGGLVSQNPVDILKFLDPGLGDGGPAADATVAGPGGLAFDSHGSLYIADAGSMRIRKVTGLDTTTPKIEAFAGIGLAAYLRRAGTAQANEEGLDARAVNLNIPGGLAFDARGNLFVGELGTIAFPLVAATEGTALGKVTDSLPAVYARIRKIATDGRVTTVAGPGTRFFADPTADDGLVLPAGLAVAPDGRLAVMDTGANLIRIIPAGSF